MCTNYFPARHGVLPRGWYPFQSETCFQILSRHQILTPGWPQYTANTWATRGRGPDAGWGARGIQLSMALTGPTREFGLADPELPKIQVWALDPPSMDHEKSGEPFRAFIRCREVPQPVIHGTNRRNRAGKAHIAPGECLTLQRPQKHVFLAIFRY